MFGVPDKHLGECICACVKKKQASSITDHNILMHFETDKLHLKPKYVIFVDDFPAVNAKVDRKVLKRMVISKFNLAE